MSNKGTKIIVVAVSAVLFIVAIIVINININRTSTDTGANNRPCTQVNEQRPDSHTQPGQNQNNQENNDTAPLPNVTSPYVIQDQFPSLHILSNYNPFDVERDFWHNGKLFLTNHADAFENVDIRIRGRGNSTWHFGEDKRPLRLRFEEPQSLLDAGHIARDWVLIANHFDLTLIRTHLAFYLASLLDGMDWTPFSQLVHLYINGEYVGLYQVADERDIGPGRMQLIFDENPAISEYLFELDNNSLNTGVEGVTFFIADGAPYDIRFPRGNSLSPGHLEYIQKFVLNVNEVVRTRDFVAISQIMDIPSMVDFYLVQELFKNIDVGFNSVFMQVRGQGENRRMFWGPVWDFDRSAGNMYYWHDYQHLHAAVRNYHFRHLLSVPEIFELAAARWIEISENQVLQMLAYISYLVENYESEFNRNFERHPVQELDRLPFWMTSMVPPHLHEIDNWGGQVEFLQEWFEGRIWWLNQFFVEDEYLQEWWRNYLVHGYGG